ncbi:MAG: hypothetical protein HZB38_03530 [Planctomycetes bacterium]|nr:hypothetical protein [Planctomycetota bacterium]
MSAQKAKQRKRQNIVSVQLAEDAKSQLDAVSDNRGMTIKMLMGKLLAWFVSLDRTEQSIVLGQVESQDIKTLAQLVIDRQVKSPSSGAARR